MIFTLSIPLALLAFVLEIYPRVINRKYGVDIWTHLLYLKEYHRQKGIPKKIKSGFLVPGDYDYPPVFIWILSKFSVKIVEKFEFLFSPFFDFIHIIIIFILSYLLSSNIYVALVAQLLYLLTPIIIIENSSATPRSLGYTLFSVFMFSMIWFSEQPNPVLIFVILVCGSLIFLSHRFTAQGLLFFAIYFSVVNQNLKPIIFFIESFLLAFLISKGFYIKVLKGHMGNLSFWKNNISYRFAHQVKGNINVQHNKDFVFRTYNQFLKFPPFVLQITNPWLIVVLYIFLFEFPHDSFLVKLVLWVVFSYILALLTIWIPKLRFLGEGQRYLELSAFPTSFLAAQFLISKINLQGVFYLGVFYFVIGIFSIITIITIQRKAIIKESIRTLTPDLERMFNFIKAMKQKPRLLCIPHQITTNTIYHTGASVFVNASYATIDQISDVYPYFRKSIVEVMKQNNLNYILLNRNYTSIPDLKLGKYQKIREEGSFILVKL